MTAALVGCFHSGVPPVSLVLTLSEESAPSFLPYPDMMVAYNPGGNGLPRWICYEHRPGGNTFHFRQSLFCRLCGRHMLQNMAAEYCSERLIAERDVGTATDYRARVTPQRSTVNVQTDIAIAMGRFIQQSAESLDSPWSPNHQ